ncbi:helix-turn-helix domain-containing protein [Nonomuraea cavernae]|uniref:Transcriptional regulator n=1 Tax=Nonomuraea cavernae TaxID=2045107 RepID=A0A918DQ20_9ACTN|nr:helix-turn-helix domain-containing protein [Nonomuraea cavernae]MCA2189897.1 helix-turn-helix domain-containing protein [Nonomuraea cavernae]GGO77822.1 transcriptional regulator [Nonomuraea cavernae]
MRPSTERWAELALHPVRIRILGAVAGARRTPSDLAGLLPDVPQATLYRHIATLAKAGLLDVVEERKVGGATERVYALPEGAVTPTAESLASASPEEHARYFTAFVSSLLSEFSRYLAREHIDLVADGVGYQQLVLHLNDEEFVRFAQGFGELVRPLLANEPGENRSPRLLATILLPLTKG